jgi:hypothetical protein
MYQLRNGFRILNWTRACAIAVALCAASFAQADIVVDWGSYVVHSDNVNPVSGFADVKITLTGADLMSPSSIDAFNLRFDLASGTGLTFSAPINAVISPLFSSPVFIPPGDVYPNTTVRVANDGNPTVLTNGVGLVRVPFTVAPGHLGQTYTINIHPLDTQLSVNGNAFNFVVSNGSVSVQSIPEPAAVFGMGVVALVSAAGAVAVRRQKQTCK